MTLITPAWTRLTSGYATPNTRWSLVVPLTAGRAFCVWYEYHSAIPAAPVLGQIATGTSFSTVTTLVAGATTQQPSYQGLSATRVGTDLVLVAVPCNPGGGYANTGPTQLVLVDCSGAAPVVVNTLTVNDRDGGVSQGWQTGTALYAGLHGSTTQVSLVTVSGTSISLSTYADTGDTQYAVALGYDGTYGMLLDGFWCYPLTLSGGVPVLGAYFSFIPYAGVPVDTLGSNELQFSQLDESWAWTPSSTPGVFYRLAIDTVPGPPHTAYSYTYVYVAKITTNGTAVPTVVAVYQLTSPGSYNETYSPSAANSASGYSIVEKPDGTVSVLSAHKNDWNATEWGYTSGSYPTISPLLLHEDIFGSPLVTEVAPPTNFLGGMTDGTSGVGGPKSCWLGLGSDGTYEMIVIGNDPTTYDTAAYYYCLSAAPTIDPPLRLFQRDDVLGPRPSSRLVTLPGNNQAPRSRQYTPFPRITQRDGSGNSGSYA